MSSAAVSRGITRGGCPARITLHLCMKDFTLLLATDIVGDQVQLTPKKLTGCSLSPPCHSLGVVHAASFVLDNYMHLTG